MISVLNTSWPIPMKIGLPSPSGMTKAAIVAIEIVDTVAILRPAMIDGTASGSSTRTSDCRRVSPMPRADSRTSAGTPRSPSRMFR